MGVRVGEGRREREGGRGKRGREGRREGRMGEEYQTGSKRRIKRRNLKKKIGLPASVTEMAFPEKKKNYP
jgi:hypothetical protein